MFIGTLMDNTKAAKTTYTGLKALIQIFIHLQIITKWDYFHS